MTIHNNNYNRQLIFFSMQLLKLYRILQTLKIHSDNRMYIETIISAPWFSSCCVIGNWKFIVKCRLYKKAVQLQPLLYILPTVHKSLNANKNESFRNILKMDENKVIQTNWLMPIFNSFFTGVRKSTQENSNL